MHRIFKSSLPLIALALFSACSSQDQSKKLQAQIDSLQASLANSYKPGFGEFMSGIQAHHSKLWFAGKNENWPLAEFEIDEIREALDNIKTFQINRKESQMVEMLNPSLDSVAISIRQKNQVLFNKHFVLLTNTCNDCHRANEFGFNVVKIPDVSPFTNQDFKVATK